MRNLAVIGVVLNVVVLLLMNAAFANGAKDTFPKGIEIKHKDTALVNACLKKARFHLEASIHVRYPKSNDSVKFYVDKAIRLSKESGYDLGLAQAYVIYSDLYSQYPQEKARDYADRARRLFEKLNNRKGIAQAQLQIAGIYDGKSEKENIAKANEAKLIYRDLKDRVGEGYADRILSELYRYTGDKEKATFYARESIQLFRQANYRKKEYVNSLLQLGLIIESENLEQAFKLVIEAVKVAEFSKSDEDLLANAYAHLGRLYTYNENHETSLHYLKKADEVAKGLTNTKFFVMNRLSIIQVLLFLERGSEAIAYTKNLDQYEGIDFHTKAALVSRFILLYCDVKRFDLAEPYVRKAQQMVKTYPAGLMASRLGIALSRYYYLTKDYRSAAYYLKPYKDWASQNNHSVMLQTAYMQQFLIDSVNGDLKAAIRSLRMHHRYKDSVLNENSKQRIAELKIQYDVLKKDRDIKLHENANKLLTKQNELQQANLARSNLMRNISIVGTVMVLGLLVLFYQRHKSNKRLNGLLQAQQQEILQRNSELQHIVGEKEWLLKEIHHRVKNNLHLIMSLLNGQLYFVDDKEAHSAIQKGLDRIQSMSLIHQKLYMSDNLSSINMQDYINDLIEYLGYSFSSQKNIKFFVSVENVQMDVSQAVPVGLILNEAITNSFKYAFPERKGNINVFLINTTGDVFSLEIIDNGIGIPTDFNIDRAKSLGMKLIKGLSEDLDGILEIKSDSQGTRVKVEFTYKHP